MALPAVLVFGRMPLVSVPANLLAVPVAGAVMLYGLPAGLVAGAVPSVAPVVMFPCRVGVRWVDARGDGWASDSSRAATPRGPAGWCCSAWRGCWSSPERPGWVRERATIVTPMAVHLLTGDDESILRSKAHDLVAQLVGDGDRSLMVDEFDGDDYEMRSVVDAAQTMPFLTDRRVVVARGIGRFNADDVAPLVAYLADPLESTAARARRGRRSAAQVAGRRRRQGGRARHRHQPAPQGRRSADVGAGAGRGARRAARAGRRGRASPTSSVRTSAASRASSPCSAPRSARASASAPPMSSRSSARPAGCRRGTSPTRSTAARPTRR